MKPRSDDVLVSVFARTDIGKQRSGNEDAFLIADLTAGRVGLGPEIASHQVGERGSVLIVSDGMGGAEAGEVASELAVKTICQSLLEVPTDFHISERLKIATEVANEYIWNEAQRNPELLGMGATVTAVLLRGATAYISQVGDSRAYLIRGERIKQITKDQSLAQALVDSGAITPDQIELVPQNVIVQALGTNPAVQVALTAVDLYRNDHLVICSDGLSGKLKPDEMCGIIHQSPDLDHACRQLVDTANERGGEDNITVIVARFDGAGLESANDSGTITDSFKVLTKDLYVKDEDPETMILGSSPPQTAGHEYAPETEPLAASSDEAEAGPETEPLETELIAQPPPEAAPQVTGPSAATTAYLRPSTSPLENTAIAETVPLVTHVVRRPKNKNRPVWLIIFMIALLVLLAVAYFIYSLY